MSKTLFAKSDDGVIHLVSAINKEFTLCGNAFDGDNDDKKKWEFIKRKNITCEECWKEILNCKNVRARL